jgi:hypothetical protein
MPHDQEVNKARYNASGSVIATKTNLGSVMLYKEK